MDVVNEQNKIVELLLDEYKKRSSKGLLPYEGQWLKYSDIEKIIKNKKRRSWIITGELFFLFIILLSASALFILLLILLCY